MFLQKSQTYLLLCSTKGENLKAVFHAVTLNRNSLSNYQKDTKTPRHKSGPYEPKSSEAIQ